MLHSAAAHHVIVGEGDGLFPDKTGEMIQQAIDALASQGGGTVELTEGVFTLHSTLYVKSHITLRGQGKKTVLKKAKAAGYSLLDRAAMRGSNIVYVKNPEKFYVGQGVNVGDTYVKANDTTLTKIRNITGNKVILEDPLIKTCESNAYIASNFSCIFVQQASNVTLQNFVLDGSRNKTPMIASWKIGGIKTWEAPHLVLENLEIKQTRGDGLTLGRSDFAFIKRLHAHHTDLIALHVANGSTYVVMSECIAHHAGKSDLFNGAGIFLCWNVQNSVFHNNKAHHNRGGGISIGKNDSNNLFLGNTLYLNKAAGIRFRCDAHAHSRNIVFLSTQVDRNFSTPFSFEGVPESLYFDSNPLQHQTFSRTLPIESRDPLDHIKNDLSKMKRVTQTTRTNIDTFFQTLENNH